MSENKKYPIITINRQYGAGGRSAARALSERLGIPFYDKDFIRETAAESGFSEEDILAEGEEISRTSHILDIILNSAVSYTSSHDAIFQAEKQSVLKLSESPCIIVGRCANLILREAGIPSFDIFLYSDIVHRVAHVRELGESDTTNIQRFIEKREARRENYYLTYGHKELCDSTNYDLCLDTGRLGIDRCAEIAGSIIENL